MQQDNDLEQLFSGLAIDETRKSEPQDTPPVMDMDHDDVIGIDCADAEQDMETLAYYAKMGRRDDASVVWDKCREWIRQASVIARHTNCVADLDRSSSERFLLLLIHYLRTLFYLHRSGDAAHMISYKSAVGDCLDAVANVTIDLNDTTMLLQEYIPDLLVIVNGYAVTYPNSHKVMPSVLHMYRCIFTRSFDCSSVPLDSLRMDSTDTVILAMLSFGATVDAFQNTGASALLGVRRFLRFLIRQEVYHVQHPFFSALFSQALAHINHHTGDSSEEKTNLVTYVMFMNALYPIVKKAYPQLAMTGHNTLARLLKLCTQREMDDVAYYVSKVLSSWDTPSINV